MSPSVAGTKRYNLLHEATDWVNGVFLWVKMRPCYRRVFQQFLGCRFFKVSVGCEGKLVSLDGVGYG